MMGPKAYERYFLTLIDATKVFAIERGDKRYLYSYDWEMLEMFEDMGTTFKEWCIEDVEERQGEEADRIETVYKSAERSETMNGDDE
jgi:hypothetical protein